LTLLASFLSPQKKKRKQKLLMVTYSYIPPAYKTPTKMSSTTPSTASLLQQSTTKASREPHIPYRDTGAAGKYIFGQPPSWTYKPLPSFPCEKLEESPSKPLLSKFHEADIDSMSMKTETSVNESQFNEAKKKVRWRRLSRTSQSASAQPHRSNRAAGGFQKLFAL
jgi:hypothetical protein